MAAAARDAVQTITFSGRLLQLPFELQECIVKMVLTHDEPILEFGALYSNPRGHQLGERERHAQLKHLAVTKVCREYQKYVRYYIEKNTFAFLDTQGLAFFLKRVGRHRYNWVRSIMLVSPQFNQERHLVGTLSPAIALPLFINLERLTMVEGTMMSHHSGVNSLMEYGLLGLSGETRLTQEKGTFTNWPSCGRRCGTSTSSKPSTCPGRAS